MREPRDRVRLPRPRRMLHQVPVPRPLHPRRLDQPGHSPPLVIPREQHLLRLRLLARVGIHIDLDLQVHERPQQLQPGVALQDLLPEVRRRRTVRIHRVPRSLVRTLIERQEPRLRPSELRRHPHLGVRHHEMHQRPLREPEQRLTCRRPVEPVLVHRVPDRLCEVRLQLDCRYRDAVHEQHQIQRLVWMLRRVMHLTHHSHPHLRVRVERVGVVPGRRPELRHPELHRATVQRHHRETLMQKPDRPTVLQRIQIQRLRQTTQDAASRRVTLSVGVVRTNDFRELSRLRVLEPPEHVLGEQCELTVVPGISGRVQPPVRGEMLRDLVLQHRLQMRPSNTTHAATPTSIFPITAAEISAARRSRASSIAIVANPIARSEFADERRMRSTTSA